MKAIVTGGAGFIGSHLAGALLKEVDRVLVLDNLSRGKKENLMEYLGEPGFSFIEQDLSIAGDWMSLAERGDLIFHYAANPDVRTSGSNPMGQLKDNVLTTFNVLEMARRGDADLFVLASSSTVYGDAEVIPTPEDHPPKPISVYGWTKLMAEQAVSMYSSTYGIRALILRLANVVGPRSSHGVIVDFIRKLKADPSRLVILGDGTQRKSYIYVTDVVNANIHLWKWFSRSGKRLEVFNVGNEDWVTVSEIADIVVEEMGLEGVKYEFLPSREGRGWPGDVKLMLLDVKKIQRTGWRPTLSSREAVRRTVRAILRGVF